MFKKKFFTGCFLFYYLFSKTVLRFEKVYRTWTSLPLLRIDWFLWARDSAKFWKCFTSSRCHNFSCRSQKAIQKWRGVVVGVLLHVSNNYTNYLTFKTMSFSSHIEIQLSSWVLIKVNELMMRWFLSFWEIGMYCS